MFIEFSSCWFSKLANLMRLKSGSVTFTMKVSNFQYWLLKNAHSTSSFSFEHIQFFHFELTIICWIGVLTFCNLSNPIKFVPNLVSPNLNNSKLFSLLENSLNKAWLLWQFVTNFILVLASFTILWTSQFFQYPPRQDQCHRLYKHYK
jgi:hypothetical protein